MTDRDSPAGRRDAAALAGYHARKFAELMELARFAFAPRKATRHQLFRLTRPV